MLGAVLGNVYGITLGVDVGTEMGYLGGSFYDYKSGNLKGLFIGGSIGSTDCKPGIYLC